MPRSCTICEHPNRGAMDEALVGGGRIVRLRRYTTFPKRRCVATRPTTYPQASITFAVLASISLVLRCLIVEITYYGIRRR
jgi:hypothetical protein